MALTVLLTVTSANAFGNNNSWDTPWNSYNANSSEDNGIFAYNGFSFWDPRWYATEFTNMVNEFDDEFSNNYVQPQYQYRGNPKQFPVSVK